MIMFVGPYHKSSRPVLKTKDAVIGPGACCVVKVSNGTEWMLYHSWDPKRTYRAMSIAELEWKGKEPFVRVSWGKPEPAPYAKSSNRSGWGHSVSHFFKSLWQ